MKIPKTFSLVNRKYRVIEMPEDVGEAAGLYGDCDRAKATIRVRLDHP